MHPRIRRSRLPPVSAAWLVAVIGIKLLLAASLVVVHPVGEAFVVLPASHDIPFHGNNRATAHPKQPFHHLHQTRKRKVQGLFAGLPYLTSCLESLTPTENGRRLIEWMDPSSSHGTEADESSANTTIMPLYPLSACYVPCSSIVSNHTTSTDSSVDPNNNNSNASTYYYLRNTEPRNIQMALDLIQHGDCCFCAVLRAEDTGKIATVGTVLRIVEHDIQYDSSSSVTTTNNHNNRTNIARIRLTCVPERVVDIVQVENPQAASVPYRWQHAQEYLRARVRTRQDDDDNEQNVLVLQQLQQTLAHDYRQVRRYYVQGDIAADDLPPYSIPALANALPDWPMNENHLDFWNLVAKWQSLCETIREAKQMSLASDRNEMLVNAAIRQGGGPLKLPVHLEDLECANERKAIMDLEQERHSAWLEMQLDPCLDMQVLLTLRTESERYQYFGSMISRERHRLEQQQQQQASSSNVSNKNTVVDADQRDFQDPPRKGAWFEEGW